MQIKREKAQADIAIAEFKARQWAEIERFKVGLKASLQADEQNRGILVMTDDNEQIYSRAREVLADAGWLFDDFVNNEMRRVLTSDPDDMTTREIAYNRARVATELKAALAAWSRSTKPTPS